MKPLNLIVHHTASLATPGHLQLKAVNNYHKNKDWGHGSRIPKSQLGWYVAYHYFIDTDGSIMQTANDNEVRWHAGARNLDSIGICLAGQFDKGFNTVPTVYQTKTLQVLLRRLTAKYGILVSRVYPHRKFAQKTCYGLNLANDWASKLVPVGKALHQIISLSDLTKYKASDYHKLPDGRIVLDDGVSSVPGTTRIIYL